jgi:hypothetical protein
MKATITSVSANRIEADVRGRRQAIDLYIARKQDKKLPSVGQIVEVKRVVNNPYLILI